LLLWYSNLGLRSIFSRNIFYDCEWIVLQHTNWEYQSVCIITIKLYKTQVYSYYAFSIIFILSSGSIQSQWTKLPRMTYWLHAMRTSMHCDGLGWLSSPDSRGRAPVAPGAPGLWSSGCHFSLPGRPVGSVAPNPTPLSLEERKVIQLVNDVLQDYRKIDRKLSFPCRSSTHHASTFRLSNFTATL
jgi:hypothetical protein